MASCCNNTVTPRMIKAGNVSIGDKIQLEDIPASSEKAGTGQEAKIPDKKDYIPVQSSNLEGIAAGNRAAGTAGTNSTGTDSASTGSVSTGSLNGDLPNTDSSRATSSNPYSPRSNSPKFEPLPYSQMTSYMNNVSLAGNTESPSIITPQDPMTPNGFEEEIDYNSVQAFNGFLRTQIGRYMRVEQLIGSNTVEDRFGFLVGVGTNFIILQEITTGNIMVLDIFSIRLTYVYYSQPVIPQF